MADRESKKVGKAVPVKRPPEKPRKLSAPLPGLRESEDHYLPEHADDTASRHESMREAYEHVDAFAERHKAALVELLWTYGDSEAERKLEALRERFWSVRPCGDEAAWQRATGKP